MVLSKLLELGTTKQKASNIGLRESIHELTLYLKQGLNENKLIVSLNVDDLLITFDNEVKPAKFKNEMISTFEMTDLELMKYFFGFGSFTKFTRYLYFSSKICW